MTSAVKEKQTATGDARGQHAEQSQRDLAAFRAAPLGDAGAPERVVLAPWGDVESTAGSFVVDAESARLVVEAFDAHGADLPIDFEHQTLGGEYASPSGRAPAAGWIKRLEAVEGEGIVAVVNWTDEGSRMIVERSYRYLSPVALIRRRDRKLVALHSAALTNKPAIVGMAALVNGAGAGRTGVECGADGEDSRAELCQLLSLSQSVEVDEVLVVAADRIRQLETEVANRDAVSLVETAMSAGKLTAAQRSWAMSLAVEDRRRFDEWLRTAPVVAPMGRSGRPSAAAMSGAGAANRARSEYRSSALLRQLTSEEAYVADAVRSSAPAI